MPGRFIASMRNTGFHFEKSTSVPLDAIFFGLRSLILSATGSGRRLGDSESAAIATAITDAPIANPGESRRAKGIADAARTAPARKTVAGGDSQLMKGTARRHASAAPVRSAL